MGMQWLCSLNCVTWQKIYKTKVKQHLNFIRCRSHFWICNVDLVGPGPHVLWSIIFRQSLQNKSCNAPSQQQAQSGLNLLALDLALNLGSEGPKMGSGWLCSLKHETWQKLYKTSYRASMIQKGHNTSWTQNLDLEGNGLHVLLELWSIIFRQSL